MDTTATTGGVDDDTATVQGLARMPPRIGMLLVCRYRHRRRDCAGVVLPPEEIGEIPQNTLDVVLCWRNTNNSNHNKGAKTMTERESSNATGSGIGFTGLLTIVFVTLKLLGKIDWSWWWVLSPLWISATVVIGVAVVTIIIAVIVWYTNRGK